MIENGPVVPAHFTLRRNEGGLGAARRLAYIAHVVDMKGDEFAESFQVSYTGLGWLSPHSW